MKSLFHAAAGVTGFLLIVTFLASSIASVLLGSPGTIALVTTMNLIGLGVLIPLLAAVGASGVSLLGKRTDSLAAAKQKRGPIAFMTSLLVLLPLAVLLWWRASDGVFDAIFYGAQVLELLAGSVAMTMIGLNIRDGLALTGRIGEPRSADAGPEIKARDGGPLVARSLPVFTGPDGASLKQKPVAALCRCGASKTKPYCDGSHNEIQFDSSASPDATKDQVLTYEGKHLTVHYNRLLCSHAAECGTRQKAAFDSSRKPWIMPDEASPEDIMEVVKACPSGALRYSLPGEPPQHALADVAGVTVERNGPLRVAHIPLAAPRLAEGACPDKYVLCRCGASKNKPYCDGSHYDIGWTDSDASRASGGTSERRNERARRIGRAEPR